MEVSKSWKMVEFLKIWIKMKNCKTFYEGQTVSRVKQIIQPLHHLSPNQIKSYYASGTKSFLQTYTERYRHLLSKCFQNAVLGRQGRCSTNVFFDTKQKNVDSKTCKMRKVFSCVATAYYFQFQVTWGS